MPELVKNDLLFVKIAPQKKISCSSRTDGGHFGNQEGHRSTFLRSPSKVPKTTKKLSYHENGRGIQKK